jgi:hypothetical protein
VTQTVAENKDENNDYGDTAPRRVGLGLGPDKKETSGSQTRVLKNPQLLTNDRESS